MTLTLMWEGIAIALSHKIAFLGGPYDHIELRAPEPLPVTTTGYRSHFIMPEELALFGGPEAFVRQWLDDAAQNEEWQEHLRQRRQLSLF